MLVVLFMIFKNNNSHKVGTDQNNKGRKEQIFYENNWPVPGGE